MLHKHTQEKSNSPIAYYNHHHRPIPLDNKLLSQDLQQLALSDGHSKIDKGQVDVQEPHHPQTNKYTIPLKGLPSELTYSLIHNELTLDGNPHLNLASFVNTFTTAEAKRLVTENLNKNLADNDEYPQLIEITQRCVSMLAQLWRCSEDKTPLGCATTGSSEAIMLGGLAMKRQWERKMRSKGKSTSKPNIIMSSAAQVALEKFARYFDVECRLVPVSHGSCHRLDPKSLWDYVDENTIGCFVILGTTYTGHLENVEQVGEVLDEIEKENPEWSNGPIPIHVDGASGGFIVPFAFEKSQLKNFGLPRWGFDHPRVVSINTSGHKFGLTTPGLGWVLWSDDEYLLPELRFKLKYLGGVEETFNLNFSRPGFQVIHQYFNFLSLGKAGYKELFQRSLFVARYFSHRLLTHPELGEYFEIVSCLHERIDGKEELPSNANDFWDNPQDYKPGVPLVAFRLNKKFYEKFPEIPQALISTLLRAKGWIIPNYPLPASFDGSDEWEVLRIVFRAEMRMDLAQLLIKDLEVAMRKLLRSYEHISKGVIDEKIPESGKRDTIYQMLLTLAASGDEIGENKNTEGSGKETEEHKKNYRGTC